MDWLGCFLIAAILLVMALWAAFVVRLLEGMMGKKDEKKAGKKAAGPPPLPATPPLPAWVDDLVKTQEANTAALQIAAQVIGELREEIRKQRCDVLGTKEEVAKKRIIKLRVVVGGVATNRIETQA